MLNNLFTSSFKILRNPLVVAVLSVLFFLLVTGLKKDSFLDAARVEELAFPANRKPSLMESITYWKLKQIPENSRIDYAISGDSTALMNVYTEGLRNGNQTSYGYNMGTSAGLERLGIRTLRYYRGNKKKLKILIFHYTLWYFERIGGFKLDFDILSYKESLKITSQDIDFFKSGISARNTFQGWWSSLGSGVGSGDIPIEKGFYPSHNELGGLLALQSGYLEETRPVEKPLEIHTFNPDEGQLQKLKEDIISGLEISENVLFCMSPIYKNSLNAQDAEKLEAFITELEAIEKSNQNLFVMKPVIREFPLELFMNGKHLSLEGAKRNTREIRDYIESNIFK